MYNKEILHSSLHYVYNLMNVLFIHINFKFLCKYHLFDTQ